MRSRAIRLTIPVRALLLCAALALEASTGPAAAAEREARWRESYFPNLPLVTQEGETLHFYDDLIKDKIVAINFIFTSCENSCPAETARLREIQKLLGDRMGNDVFFYSISIDPAHDTPEVLKAYAEKFQVGPGWLFLTGEEADITVLRKKLGLFIEEIQDDPTDHNLSLIVGNEATGRWMKRSPFDNPQVLASLIGNWLRDGKTRSGSGHGYREARALPKFTRGEYLFRTRCTSCHSLGQGDGLGPDLRGVTARRDHDWLARWMKTPDQLLAERDPIALELFARYQELPMPNLGLTDLDVRALVEFLKKADASQDERDPPGRQVSRDRP